MVCTVYAIKTAAAARHYYNKTDDYYRERGHAPTAWMGKGAEALGLRGEVSVEQAEALMEGYLPNGERVGGDDHRPGWDVTFSAPKSASYAAYVLGDDRLITEWNESIRETVEEAEREIAATRIRENGGIRTEATGNLVVSAYRHDVSRDGDGQIHTHCIFMNVTQSADERWRSLESQPIYRSQLDLGATCRAIFAKRCAALGYEIEKTMVGKEPGFELKCVSEAERELFSKRSRAVEAELERMGLTRETATAAQKQTAALNTRKRKDVKRENLMDEWRAEARAAGFEPRKPPKAKKLDQRVTQGKADTAVVSAVAHLSERETRFTEQQIVSEARKLGMGEFDDRDIRASIQRAVARHDLPAVQTRQYDAITGQKTVQPGYTTREAQQTELKMIAHANAAVGAVRPAMAIEKADLAIKAQEQKTGFDFNQGQRDATHAILSGRDRITLIQGYAGTAKTNSVLVTSAAALQEQGYEVIAMAPTNSAAQTLGDALGVKAQTVAKFLHSKHEAPSGNRIYIVDEMSMLSARDTEKLLARTQDGRLAAVGDRQQIGSVEGGAAFRQMQDESRLKTQKLEVIVRQRNEQLKSAVYDAIKGDVRSALAKIEVVELGTRPERVAAIADRYVSMSREGQQKTIIISPGRDDRLEINEAVRTRLKAKGELGEGREVQVLVGKDLTSEELKRAASFAVGDRLEAGRDYKSLGLKKGESAVVMKVDVDKNRVTINTGRAWRDIDPAKFTKLKAFESTALEVAAGDVIVHRSNAAELKNGVALDVEKVTETHIHARDGNGKLHRLGTDANLQISHGYGQTGHESQGRQKPTALFHAESNRVNLMTQQNFYVPISRAIDTAIIYTDSRERLAAQIERETGQKETALDRDQPGHESEFGIGNGYPNPNPNRIHLSESEMGIGIGNDHDPATLRQQFEGDEAMVRLGGVPPWEKLVPFSDTMEGTVHVSPDLAPSSDRPGEIVVETQQENSYER